ncbi:MAG: CBS domain-containing protein [Anaerolineae bacterium]|nr:CBS domain-containing protein [Anaerolineae bacterium]
MKRQFALLGFMGRGGAVTKLHELVREMQVTRVMTSNLLTLPPDAPMAALKELLREHRISGVPIVEDGRLVGVASIEDVIHALEEQRLDAPLSEYMTHDGLITAHAQEPVMEALRRFEKTGVGRMPVLDSRGQLTGIITRGDITIALLRALQELYTEAEAMQDRPQHFFEALESENTSLQLRYHVVRGNFAGGGDASGKIKRALLRIGASPQLARRVAIATYEAEVNLIIHTSAGGLILADIQPMEITVVAQDSGPGIPDVDLARQPGYSTATPEIREMGFGAGMGLTNIERCADKMSLWSAVGVGTRLQMTFQVSPKEAGESDES